ncbi:MAG: leucine-rich repeat protein [Oscillospiraceae bacterium]|nr:leucine-rich repeat protein [Oscillospiraceae bacterium]
MMKLRYSVLAAALLLTAACPMAAYAEEETAAETAVQAGDPTDGEVHTTEDGLFTYAYENGGMALYDFLPSDTYEGAVEIPSEIAGVPVTYLGNALFQGAAKVTEISIPAGVTDTGSSVFFGCLALERFTVDPANTYLAADEDGVLLGDGGRYFVAYPAGRKAESYTVPDGVDEIAPGAFGFSVLRELSFPDSVAYIDAWACAYTDLASVTLGSGTVQLDDYCFAYSEHLTDITLNEGLTTITGAAFAGCKALNEVALPSTLQTVGQYAFAGTGMRSVTIPPGVQEILYGAFGYDIDLAPMSDFVVFGIEGTLAQQYCTDTDEDNDYQNNFTFVAVDNTDTPVSLEEYEAGIPEDADAAPDADADVDADADAATEADADAEAPETAAADPTGEVGAALKSVPNARTGLTVAGIGAALLAAVLAVFYVLHRKKPAEDKPEDKPEEDAE